MLDNASIHWNLMLIQMCDEINVIFVRLFFYSSDINLIETLFALLRTWIRRNEKFDISYIDDYEKFEKFLRNAVKVQNELKNSRNLFRMIDIQYLTVNVINI
jgi:transposase